MMEDVDSNKAPQNATSSCQRCLPLCFAAIQSTPAENLTRLTLSTKSQRGAWLLFAYQDVLEWTGPCGLTRPASQGSPKINSST